MRALLSIAVTALLSTGVWTAQDRSATPTRLPAAIVPTPGSSQGPPNGPPNGPATGGDLLHDNGTADGVNGYSNATASAFGFRRTLLDDFTVPAATTWNVGCIAWTHLWGIEDPPIGTGAEFDLRLDAAGTPGAVFKTLNVTSFTEMATGTWYFTRPEVASTATFDPVSLGTGTYWFDGTIVGPDNNFWLTAGNGVLNGSECWVDYEDLGGFQPGSAIFGAVSDLNFQLHESDDPLLFYCNPADGHPNNTATMSVDGTVLDGSDINVCMAGGPPGQSAYLLIGTLSGVVDQPPGSKGALCIVGGPIGRYLLDIQALDAGGGMCIDLKSDITTFGCPDYTIPNTSCGQQIQPGETWYFQYWHRQPMGQPSSFSEAVCVTFSS